VTRLFYRIVRTDPPSLDDFKSARELGKPLGNVRYVREWSNSISVYDDYDHAVERAAANRFLLGDRIATLEIPDDRFEIAQTTRDRRHFSIYASAENIIRFVSGPIVSIVGPERK
jgi:hypothetical protein